MTSAAFRRGRWGSPRAHGCGRHCEMCSDVLGRKHQHLADADRGTPICVCAGCALARAEAQAEADAEDAAGCVAFPAFRPGRGERDFPLPVGLSIVFRTITDERLVAWYPTAGGAAEVALPAKAFRRLTAANPGLAVWQPGDQALLVRRSVPVPSRYACLLMPSKPCLELIGAAQRGRVRGLSHQQAKISLQDLWTATVPSGF